MQWLYWKIGDQDDSSSNSRVAFIIVEQDKLPLPCNVSNKPIDIFYDSFILSDITPLWNYSQLDKT